MVLGVREIVIGVVALLLAYVAYLALRFVRLPRRGPKPEPEIHPEYQTVLDLDPEPPRSATPSARAPETVTAALTTGAPEREAREPFDAMVELARLRFQIEALQAGQLTLRADLDSLRGELEALRNARNVAPQYGEAVVLAQRGLDGAAIAERCGISVSEAELVAALARGAHKQE